MYHPSQAPDDAGTEYIVADNKVVERMRGLLDARQREHGLPLCC